MPSNVQVPQRGVDSPLAEYVAAVVARAPELTEAQSARLRVLLADARPAKAAA